MKCKRFRVSAKYFLWAVIDDPEVNYPVNIYVQQFGGGASYVVLNKRELEEMCLSDAIVCNKVIRFLIKDGHMYIDLRKNGELEVPGNILSEKDNMCLLSQSKVKKLYYLVQNRENSDQEDI